MYIYIYTYLLYMYIYEHIYIYIYILYVCISIYTVYMLIIRTSRTYVNRITLVETPAILGQVVACIVLMVPFWCGWKPQKEYKKHQLGWSPQYCWSHTSYILYYIYVHLFIYLDLSLYMHLIIYIYVMVYSKLLASSIPNLSIHVNKQQWIRTGGFHHPKWSIWGSRLYRSWYPNHLNLNPSSCSSMIAIFWSISMIAKFLPVMFVYVCLV